MVRNSRSVTFREIIASFREFRVVMRFNTSGQGCKNPDDFRLLSGAFLGCLVAR